MMSPVDVQWPAVLVAAALNMVLGSLWYGPLFGKPWMKSMGWDPNQPMTPEKRKAGNRAMMWVIPVSLLTAYVLAHFVDYTASVTWRDGAVTGFWLWLGFQLTLLVQEVLFSGKKKQTLYINASYQLAALMLMGAILASWA